MKTASLSLFLLVISDFDFKTRTPVFHDETTYVVKGLSEMMTTDARQEHDYVAARIRAENNTVTRSRDIAEPYFNA
jgi:hypothetical protein